MHHAFRGRHMWLSKENQSGATPKKGSGSSNSAANVDLRKLRRLDLLELLVDQIRENEDNEKTIEELTDLSERLKAKLDDKDVQIEHLKSRLNDTSLKKRLIWVRRFFYPSIAALVGNLIMFFGSFCMACHKVNFICIFIQLSTEVLVALLILIAISGLRDDFSFTNSDRVFLVTPSILAASVTVKFNGFIISSKKTLPGCVGFLLISIPP